MKNFISELHSRTRSFKEKIDYGCEKWKEIEILKYKIWHNQQCYKVFSKRLCNKKLPVIRTQCFWNRNNGPRYCNIQRNDIKNAFKLFGIASNSHKIGSFEIGISCEMPCFISRRRIIIIHMISVFAIKNFSLKIGILRTYKNMVPV